MVQRTEDKLTVADFFCGAGGFSEGFRQMGFEVKFGLDYWKPAINTFKLNHPGAQTLLTDVLELSPEQIIAHDMIPDVDVIVGSPPCVAFSGSNRAGNANKTIGIQLIEKYLQIVALKKHKKGSRLKYWLMENVPNSRNYVKDEYTFKMLGLDNKTLRALKIDFSENDVALRIDKSLENVHNAVHFGVPQRRERFICGQFIKPTPTTPTQEDWVTLGHVLDALRSTASQIKDPNYGILISNIQITDHFYDTTIPRFEWEDARNKKLQARYYGRMSFPEDESKPSRTVMATKSVVSRESMILRNGHPEIYRSPTIREVAALMSFPLTYLFQGSNESTKYRLVGNAVCPKMSAAFARAILIEHKKRTPSEAFIHRPEKEKLIANLREKQPSLKKSRNRDIYSTFAEIVPDLKQGNYRVELTNSLNKQNKKIRWEASIHHATGKDSMKKALPTQSQIKAVLKDVDEEKLNEFMVQVERTFSGRIPTAMKFQEQYCLVKPDSQHFTPREALSKVKSLVDKHFPEQKYGAVILPLGNHIQFDRGEPPRGGVPLRHLLALYSVNLIAKLTR